MHEELACIHLENISNRQLDAAPLSCGVPLARGKLHTPDHLALRMEDGALLSVQPRVTERWHDGSIRWLLLHWHMPLAPNAKTDVCLTCGGTAPEPDMSIDRDATGITIGTRHYRVRLDTEHFSLFAFWKDGERDMVAPGSDLVLETPEGKIYCASLAQRIDSRILEYGPEKTAIETSGRMTAEDDSECLDFRLRHTFRAADPVVRISHKMINREAPERGIHIKRLWLELPTTLGARTVKTVRQMTHGDQWWPRAVAIRENVELQSGSFVSDMARSVYGTDHDGKVVIRNFDSFREDVGAYPHYLRPGNARTDMTGGLMAAYPHLIAMGDGAGAVGWFEQMALHHPKAVAFDRGVFRFDIWPDFAEPLRLNRGMAREHDLCLAFRAAGASPEALESLYFDHEVMGFGGFAQGEPPVRITCDPEYARACEVFDLHRWLPYDEERYLAIETRLGSAGARATIAAGGELNLGDGIIRDCSANNENDAILDRFRAYFRQGEPSFLASALVSARHNAHVDFIAHDPDPLRQGTMAAHCPNHSDGATYPSHMWVGGLLAAYCLTGEPDFEEAALAVGENMRRWQTMRPEIFYCDSRECGWPMLAYVQLWHHTHHQKYLDWADEVFVAYRDMMNDDGEILHDIPHGLGTLRMGYGEFMTWRACFFYYDATEKKEVRDFLIRCLSLPAVYRLTPARHVRGGWASNDLFPAWAAYALTGEARYLSDNMPFMKYLMTQSRFGWGGIDMHYFLNALHERGELKLFC